MAPYALIIADPNTDSLGEIRSTHRTLAGAGRAWHRLEWSRWAYVAERRADGSYPLRIEALDLPAHQAALAAATHAGDA